MKLDRTRLEEIKQEAQLAALSGVNLIYTPDEILLLAELALDGESEGENAETWRETALHYELSNQLLEEEIRELEARLDKVRDAAEG